MMRYPATVLCALLLCGCTTLPMGDKSADAERKSFAAKPDVAGVYIYCREWMGAWTRTNVLIDDQPYGQNASYTYLYAELAPGRHTVTVEAENTDTLAFDVAPAANYYVWQETKLGWFSPRTRLHLMAEADGRKGVESARLALASYRVDDQVPARAAGAAGLGAALASMLLILLHGLVMPLP